MSTGVIVALSILGAIILIGIIIVIWGISTNNTLIRMRNNCDEAFSTMDVYLKKRYDLIPNLIETVKGYAKHESGTFEKVMQARYNAMNSQGDEKVKNENILSDTLKSLFAVTENYPQLKADRNFSELMANLNEIESEIASSRKFYNANVKEYNIKREVFPSSIIARWFKFEKRTLYELDDINERKNVKVEF